VTDRHEANSKEPLEGRHKYLLGVLGVASFFDGYDTALLAIILPDIGAQFGLSQSAKSFLLATVFMGAIPALFLSRRADKLGRRRVLLVSLLGYTIFTGLTALSTAAWIFAGIQFVARFFVMTESAVAHVMIAEELPATRRGFGFGILAMLTGLGTGIAAVMNSIFGVAGISWQWLYVAGVPPLVLMMFLRRRLPESRRFVEARSNGHLARHWTAILRPPHRKWLLLVCAVAFTSSTATYAVEFVVDFLQNDRGLTKAASTGVLVLAGVPAIILMVVAGALSDRVGRKIVGCVGAAMGVVGGVVFYNVPLGFWAVLPLIAFTVVGFSIAWPTISAYNAELFPTALRSQAGSWATLWRTIGQVASLVGGGLLVAWTGSVPTTVTLLSIGPALMVVLVAVLFPHTHGRELEDLSPEVEEHPGGASVLDLTTEISEVARRN